MDGTEMIGIESQRGHTGRNGGPRQSTLRKSTGHACTRNHFLYAATMQGREEVFSVTVMMMTLVTLYVDRKATGINLL